MLFKNQKDGKISCDLHREFVMKDIKGYKENGCNILTLELLTEGWSCCQPVLMYLHKGGVIEATCYPGLCISPAFRWESGTIDSDHIT